MGAAPEIRDVGAGSTVSDDAAVLRRIEWNPRPARFALRFRQTRFDVFASCPTASHPELELSQLRWLLPQALDRDHRGRSAEDRRAKVEPRRRRRHPARRLARRASLEKAVPARSSGRRRLRLSGRQGAVPHPCEIRRAGQAARLPGVSVRPASGWTEAGAQSAVQLSVGRREQGPAGQPAGSRTQADRRTHRTAHGRSDSAAGHFARRAASNGPTSIAS